MPFSSNAGAGGSGRSAASVSRGLQHVSSGRVVCKSVCVSGGVCGKGREGSPLSRVFPVGSVYTDAHFASCGWEPQDLRGP